MSCLVCDRDSNATPLITMEYRGNRIQICPQHLPIIIHNPSELIGLLPGAERLEPAAHKD
jgi:hypothetical protein